MSAETQFVCKAAGTSSELGCVFGYAAVESIGGDAYFDTQGEQVPALVMAKAFVDAPDQVVTKVQHDGEAVGKVVFAMPIGLDESSDLVSKSGTKGVYVGCSFDEDTLAKFADGTLTGFSIAGSGTVEEVA